MNGNDATTQWDDRFEDETPQIANMDEIDFICPAHNGAPIVSSYIRTFITLDEKILNGEPGSTEVFSPTWHGHGRPQDPNWRRINAPGTTGVVYDVRDYPEKTDC